MKTTHQASRDAVLHAFSIEENRNADTLAIYLKRYPQFRESLINLSNELFLAPSFDEIPVEISPSDDAKGAWSKFQSMLSPEDPASSAQSVVSNPLSNLDRQGFRDLAKKLNLNTLFLFRLRDCTIQVTTIPQRFLLLIAKALKVSVEELRSALEAPPQLSTASRFKASEKPSVSDKISFDEALTQSQLSEEQQAMLRAMKD